MTDDDRIHQIAELIDGFSYNGMMEFANQLVDSDDDPKALTVETVPSDVAIWLSEWARVRLEADKEAQA